MSYPGSTTTLFALTPLTQTTSSASTSPKQAETQKQPVEPGICAAGEFAARWWQPLDDAIGTR